MVGLLLLWSLVILAVDPLVGIYREWLLRYRGLIRTKAIETVFNKPAR